jgi:lysine 6-dehydrogenase
MRAAVLGGGRQGLACALDLLREEDLTELRLMDSDADLLDRARTLLSDPRVKTARIDAADEGSLVSALKGCTVLVSAVPISQSGVTRAAIHAGCSMTDMEATPTSCFSSDRWIRKPRGRRHGRSRPRARSGWGTSPAMHAIAEWTTFQIDPLRRASARTRPPLGYALFFSMHGLLNEYSGDSVCLRDGKIERRPTLTESEWIQFPEPVGLCRATHTSGGISTLPWSLEGKVRRLDYKTVRYPGHWPRIAFLKEIGLLATRPLRIGRTTLPPRDVLAALLQPVLIVRNARRRGPSPAHGDAPGEPVTRQFDLMEWRLSPSDRNDEADRIPHCRRGASARRGQIAGPGRAAESSVDATRIAHLRSRRSLWSSRRCPVRAEPDSQAWPAGGPRARASAREAL